jgi:hypothetical protein
MREKMDFYKKSIYLIDLWVDGGRAMGEVVQWPTAAGGGRVVSA